jgi:hypothetical protein
MTDSRSKHAWLRALGRADLPARIRLADAEYTHTRTYKHDFFAATGLYGGPGGQIVLKVGRAAPLFGLPMSWLGRFLMQREEEIYRAAGDLPGVPRWLGRWGETGLIHAYVEGHPLQPRESVDELFFPRLAELLDELHRRHIAYVDLEKRENIIVDDDGRPHLIDFQISWYWPAGTGCRQGLRRLIPEELGQFMLARLKEGDLYHLLKHRRRHEPEALTPEQRAASYRHGGLISLHRRLFRPLTLLRRRLLKFLTGRSRSAKQEGSEFLTIP